MGFSRQEYWSGLPFPSPGDLPNTGTKLRFPALQLDSLPSEPTGKPPKLPEVKPGACGHLPGLDTGFLDGQLSPPHSVLPRELHTGRRCRDAPLGTRRQSHTAQTTAGSPVPAAQRPLLLLGVLKVFLRGFLTLNY